MGMIAELRHAAAALLVACCASCMPSAGSPQAETSTLAGAAQGAAPAESVATSVGAGARSTSSESVLVIRSRSAAAARVADGLLEEIGGEIPTTVIVTPPEATTVFVAQAVNDHRPRGVVLIDNGPVRLYRAWERRFEGRAKVPVAIAVMASFVEQMIAGSGQMVGIAYEVPAVTSVTHFSTLTGQPLRRVGVIAREGFEPLLAKQAELLANAKIELVVATIPNARLDRGVLRALKRLHDVDAIWVLNDNALLSNKIISQGWLPGLIKNTKPVIVGALPFLNPELGFGAFGVLPDETELGVQAADVVLDIADSRWKVERDQVEFPIAVKKILNGRFADRYLSLSPERVKELDDVLR